MGRKLYCDGRALALLDCISKCTFGNDKFRGQNLSFPASFFLLLPPPSPQSSSWNDIFRSQFSRGCHGCLSSSRARDKRSGFLSHGLSSRNRDDQHLVPSLYRLLQLLSAAFLSPPYLTSGVKSDMEIRKLYRCDLRKN